MSGDKPDLSTLSEEGLAVRRAVVGEDYVDRALANVTDFNLPLQEFVSNVAWGDIWTRPGLARRDRSILNLGMLIALNRAAELKLHMRGALRNGITEEELRECLLQSAIYCGAPAALEAFRIAAEVLAEHRAEQSGADKDGAAK